MTGALDLRFDAAENEAAESVVFFHVYLFIFCFTFVVSEHFKAGSHMQNTKQKVKQTGTKVPQNYT